MKKRTAIRAALYIFIILLYASCATMKKNPYPDMRELRNGDQSIYVFNENQTKLVVYIEGSGLNSVLGVKEFIKWEQVHFAYFLANNLENDFTLAIPEKLDFKAGRDYQQDKEAIRKYTVESLAEAYSRKIDLYLDTTSFDEVYLLGGSEGGLLLPRIYKELRNKWKVRKMIVWGAGGLSQEECFRILATSAVRMPQGYRRECERIDEAVKNIAAYPDSIDKQYMGWPYTRWSSFFPYRPVDEYRTIDIPVLFIQGVEDYSSPVESVRYIEENVINDKYEYRYYENMGHMPEEQEKIAELVKTMYQWFRS